MGVNNNTYTLSDSVTGSSVFPCQIVENLSRCAEGDAGRCQAALVQDVYELVRVYAHKSVACNRVRDEYEDLWLAVDLEGESQGERRRRRSLAHFTWSYSGSHMYRGRL